MLTIDSHDVAFTYYRRATGNGPAEWRQEGEAIRQRMTSGAVAVRDLVLAEVRTELQVIKAELLTHIMAMDGETEASRQADRRMRDSLIFLDSVEQRLGGKGE